MAGNLIYIQKKRMKKLIFTLLVPVLFASCDTLYKLPTGTYTEGEAAMAIRQALEQGTGRGISFLNQTDGFFGNQAYKLFLPPDAQKIENTLRNLGMGSMVDKAILQINRAAEDAAGYAKPIFVDAIRSMTLADAIGLIRNGDTSATHFFRVKTTDQLVAAFLPVIKSSLDKLNATKYYTDVVNTYNNFPTTFKKLNPDLPGFVTHRATDALFDLISKEERNIRQNLAARTTDLLRKVFGARW